MRKVISPYPKLTLHGLTKLELKGVFGLDSGSRRTVPQVVKIISDRQDCKDSV